MKKCKGEVLEVLSVLKQRRTAMRFGVVIMAIVCLLALTPALRRVRADCVFLAPNDGYPVGHVCFFDQACPLGMDVCETDHCFTSACFDSYPAYCVDVSYCNIVSACNWNNCT
jgi:hypothetical protein